MPTTATWQLELDEDELEARLLLEPGCRLGPQDVPDLLADLTGERGLVEVDEAALREALADGDVDPSETRRIVVARGTPPEPGRDGAIEWLGTFFESCPLTRPDGSIDWYHRNKRSVEPGAEIARIHPPRPGRPGLSVRGEELPPPEALPVELELTDGAVWADADASLVLAARGGMVEHARGRLDVCPLHEVDAVDFGTGAIDFDGTVHVRGDVKDLFSIEARGAVRIDGFVEAASLTAGSTIEIRGGMAGHGKARLECGGDLETAYVWDADIRCGGQVLVRGELLRCRAEVCGSVTCEGGRLVGGEWRLGGSLQVGELGSPRGVATEIVVGRHAGLEAELAELEEKLKARLLRLEKARALLERLPSRRDHLPPERLAILERAEAEARLLVAEHEDLRRLWGRLRRRVRDRRRAGTVWVARELHPGVRIWAGGHPRPLEIHEPVRGPVRIGHAAGADEPALVPA